MCIRSLKISPIVACLCAALHAAPAQSDSSHRPWRELALFAGISQSQRLDVTASPVTFAGRGYEVAGDYAAPLGGDRFAFALSFDGGIRQFKPLVTSATAQERLTGGELITTALREFSHAQTSPAFALGFALTANMSSTEHQYSDPTERIADFFVGYGTLGPAASWRASVRGGSASVWLTTPVVGLIDHPYSQTRSGSSSASVHFTDLGTLRGMNGTVTYALAEARHVGVAFAYRFSVLHYADVQPLRSASQSLSIGVITRFGQGTR